MVFQRCADLKIRLKRENPDPRHPTELENIFENWGEVALRRQLAKTDVYHIHLYAMINNKINEKERTFHVCRSDAELIEFIKEQNKRQQYIVAGISNAVGYFHVDQLNELDPRKAFRIDFWRGPCQRFLTDDCWTQLCEYEVEYKAKGLKPE